MPKPVVDRLEVVKVNIVKSDTSLSFWPCVCVKCLGESETVAKPSEVIRFDLTSKGVSRCCLGRLRTISLAGATKAACEQRKQAQTRYTSIHISPEQKSGSRWCHCENQARNNDVRTHRNGRCRSGSVAHDENADGHLPFCRWQHVRSRGKETKDSREGPIGERKLALKALGGDQGHLGVVAQPSTADQNDKAGRARAGSHGNQAGQSDIL